MQTKTTFEIALGDDAHRADIPPIQYACVEGATFTDIIKFQLPLLNKFKGAPIEVHLSAGHCDIVQATLKVHRKRGEVEVVPPERKFKTLMSQVIHDYTDLILKLRQEKNASLVLYPLRNPQEYTPTCAMLRPVAPYYEQGVELLNNYILGWGSELNFTTIART